MFWALAGALVLHLIFWFSFSLKPKPHEEIPPTLIEVSFITKAAPIKAKQNDNVVVESQPVASQLPLPPEPVQPVEKKIEKPITKQFIKPVEVKKEVPKSKIITTQKSETSVEKMVKPSKPVKTESLKKVEEVPKEKPRLSLESLQQQISQVGTEVRQQQVSERDKYISAFSSKVKRVGQDIYDRGTLPAGSLTTLVEINADGTIKSLKITRSSGNKKLDDAVENMVYSAAPYSALSFQLQSEASTLTFSRNWEFFGD